MVGVEEIVRETIVTDTVLKELDHRTKDVHSEITAEREFSIDDCLREAHTTAEVEYLLLGVGLEADLPPHPVQEPDAALFRRHQRRDRYRVTVEFRRYN